MDPGQATKKGFDDFLPSGAQAPGAQHLPRQRLAQHRAPRERRAEFGDAIDAKHALAAEDTIESYDRLDEEVTGVSARYLRSAPPTPDSSTSAWSTR